MFKYRAFISHNKLDKAIAEKIGKHLLSNNIDVWFDKWSIYAGDSLTDSISKGISASNIFILIASKNSMTSGWVRDELRIALNKRIKSPDFKLITVKIDNCKLHPFLRDYLWIDYANPKYYRRVMKQIINSILQIDQKPMRHKYKSPFYLNYLEYIIRFHGTRGSTASVSELYDMTTLDKLKSIKKHIYHSGGLAKKDFIPKSPNISGSIKLLEKTTAMERLEIRFDNILPKSFTCRFRFNHTITNNFFNDNEFVYYTIESETKKIKFILKYDETCPVKNMKVFKRLGQEEILLKSSSAKKSITYEDLLPNLYDTYVFRWTWVN